VLTVAWLLAIGGGCPTDGNGRRRMLSPNVQPVREIGEILAAGARWAWLAEVGRQAGAIAASTTVSSSESPAALRISMKSATIASVTSCGSFSVAPSLSTEMLSWST
jgi:hypothetical protein